MVKASRLLLVSVLLAIATGAQAQNVTSAVLGTVNDPSGAPVPGAEIQLISQTTSSLLSANTNTLGLFRFPIVQPGRYKLTIKANGFKSYTQADIELTASETRGLRRTCCAQSAPGDGTSQNARPSQSYQSGTLAG